jgi:hypothetical protein
MPPVAEDQSRDVQSRCPEVRQSGPPVCQGLSVSLVSKPGHHCGDMSSVCATKQPSWDSGNDSSPSWFSVPLLYGLRSELLMPVMSQSFSVTTKE